MSANDSPKRPANAKLANRVISLFGVVALLVVGFIDLRIALFGSMATALIFCLVQAIVSSAHQRRELKIKRERYRKYRKLVADQKANENVAAQLNKPDFEQRLGTFIGDSNGEAAGQSNNDQHISKAKFWQAEDYFERTPPRSFLFFRRLLKQFTDRIRMGRAKQ